MVAALRTARGSEVKAFWRTGISARAAIFSLGVSLSVKAEPDSPPFTAEDALPHVPDEFQFMHLPAVPDKSIPTDEIVLFCDGTEFSREKLHCGQIL